MEAGRRKKPLPTLPMASQVLVALFLLPLLVAGCGAHADSRPPVASPALAANEAALLVQKGRAAIAAGDTVRAEQYLTLAIARGANERLVLKDLLAACIGGSRLRGALNHALPYLQKHPDDDELRYLVASLHVSLGQEAPAREQLERLLNRNPEHANGHYLSGILDSGAALEQAREHFRTYLELQPQGRHAPEVRGRLSELQLRTERSATAADPILAERGPRSARPSYETEQHWVDVRYPRVEGDSSGAGVSEGAHR